MAELDLDFAAATTSVERQSTEAVAGLAAAFGLEATTGGAGQVDPGCHGLGSKGCFVGT